MEFRVRPEKKEDTQEGKRPQLKKILAVGIVSAVLSFVIIIYMASYFSRLAEIERIKNALDRIYSGQQIEPFAFKQPESDRWRVLGPKGIK